MLVVGDVLTVGKYPIADYTSGGWLGGLGNRRRRRCSTWRMRTRESSRAKDRCRRAPICRRSTTCCRPARPFVKMMRQGMSADEMLAAG